MFHAYFYYILGLNVSRETLCSVKQNNRYMFHVKHISIYYFFYYTNTILFLIANTAACVLSLTSIFLNIFET